MLSTNVEIFDNGLDNTSRLKSNFQVEKCQINLPLKKRYIIFTFQSFFNITWLVVILNNILPQFVKGCQNWRNYSKLAQKLPQLLF